MAKKNYIEVLCYNRIELWESRKRAKAFYYDGMMYCEGCERERYTNIYIDLCNGNTICTDGAGYESEIRAYERAKAENRYAMFDNPHNTRDYKGKIYYPIIKEVV